MCSVLTSPIIDDRFTATAAMLARY